MNNLYELKSYLVFVVVGYDEKLETGVLVNAVTFEMLAKDEKEAIEKAKKIIEKPFYRINAVYEKEVIK